MNIQTHEKWYGTEFREGRKKVRDNTGRKKGRDKLHSGKEDYNLCHSVYKYYQYIPI